MRVLFFAPTPPPYAGPEVSSKALLDQLRNGKGQLEIVHVRSNIRHENLKKGVIDLQGVMTFLRLYILFFCQIIRQTPEIVYLPLASGKVGFLRDAIIIWTSALFGKRIVVHYRGGNFHNFARNSPFWLKKLIKVTLSLVDCAIVLGNNLKFMFENLVDPEKITVLYNGLFVGKVYSNNRNPHKDIVTVLFLGNLTFPKGFYDLVSAYKKLRNVYPNIRLVFAGSLPEAKRTLSEFLASPYREYFINNIEEITAESLSFIENAASFDASYLGFVSGEKKRRTFSEADILVLPSYTEGFPMVVLEAMAAGLPVIVTPVGALSEIIEDGVNGFFAEIGDVDGLAGKMETLIRDSELRKRMGSYNKKYVSERFDITVIARDLVRIWTDALGKGGFQSSGNRCGL